MFKILMVTFGMIAAVSLQCVEWNGSSGIGHLSFCGSNGCFSRTSTLRRCENLPSGSWTTGNSLNNQYECQVFSGSGCSGSRHIARRDLRSFGFQARSFSCPWRC
ncbi:unnamed protein product [Chironomus riparius]|uniref:Secreted protein n=1 Tax=Chironomus riparius TaxID=315576 RepID=A0A9N9WY57_9DIPT|nr:unnamed protein product [Chironomus riparius]